MRTAPIKETKTAVKPGLLVVASSPFIHSGDTINKTIADVLIALVPALAAAAYYLGTDALVVTAVSAVSCVGFELVWQKLLKQPVRVQDLSALLTGVLLALTLPPSLPWWMVVSGAFVSIIFAKQVFGGFSHNPFNPAVAGHVFLQLSWPQAMNACMSPAAALSAPAHMVVSKLAVAHIALSSKLMLFVGRSAGCLGDVSGLALVLGGLYLIKRKQIFAVTPLTFLVSAAACAYLLGGGAVTQAMSGGLILCAFFMATDPVTSPVSNYGRFFFALGCGVITILLRVKGGRPEGVYYSILLMNMTVPLIDRFTISRPFGHGGA